MNNENTNELKSLVKELKDLWAKCWLLISSCWRSFSTFGKCTIGLPITFGFSVCLIVIVGFVIFLGFCSWLFFKEQKD